MEATRRQRDLLKSDRWEEWQQQDTDQRKGFPAPPPQKPCPDEAILINLIEPEELTIGNMPLIKAIGRRRSRREYSQEPLNLEELSFLLWATQGVDYDATQAFREWLISVGNAGAAQSVAPLRTVPSAGPRHPFETYLLVRHIDGLKAGLYRYLPLDHKLLFQATAQDMADEIDRAFSGWMLKSAVIFIWTAVPYRTEWRYTIVSHKMIAQESGHLCQNLYLACESIGAGACAIGGYDQDLVDALLGVDGQDEFVIYLAPVGKVKPEKRYHFDH